MAALYRQKNKARIFPTIPCKDCGSTNTKREHRSFFEKAICILTSGKYYYQKYHCKACNTSTYKSIDATETEKVFSAK